jgi:tRNA threonylcarbamoyl adenosine modification protein YeaZ
MLLLAFDTAGAVCAVALARFEAGGLQLIYRMEERIGRGHAERLVPMIDAALGSAGVSYANLDRIAVTTGPGSFTGVRVGVAAARGLALALQIPAVGVGSLPALARGAARGRGDGVAVAVLDARRGEVYAFAHDVATGAAALDAVAAPPAEIASKLNGAEGPLHLTGSGAPLVASCLDAVLFDILDTADAPDIADVAWLGARSVPGISPVPLYLRGADAKPQLGKSVARL